MLYKISLAIFTASILWGASTVVAEDVTAGGQVSVTFTVPYPELLQDEFRPNSTIKLTNKSMEKLYYIPEGFSGDIFQVFLKVDRVTPIPIEHRNEFSNPDIETYGQWERVMEHASLVLKPGQSVEWKAGEIPYSFFSLISGNPKSIQAQVLVGPGKWVSSEPVSIKLLKHKVKEFPVIFENNLLKGPQRAKSPRRIHRVTIKNKEYLFTSSCFRICEIPKNSDPDFVWEPRLGLLKIDFKLEKAPLLWFHYPMLEILDSDQSKTEFYRKKYNFKYGDDDYRQRALKGMASHGTAASVHLFDEYKGSNELLLQHRDRYECMQLLLNRAGKVKDDKQARKLVLETLFGKDLKLDKKTITLPPLEYQENEKHKVAEFLDDFINNKGSSILTEKDQERIKLLVANIKKHQAKPSNYP